MHSLLENLEVIKKMPIFAPSEWKFWLRRWVRGVRPYRPCSILKATFKGRLFLFLVEFSKDAIEFWVCCQSSLYGDGLAPKAIGYDLYLCEISNGDQVIVNGKGEIIKWKRTAYPMWIHCSWGMLIRARCFAWSNRDIQNKRSMGISCGLPAVHNGPEFQHQDSPFLVNGVGQ